MSRGFMPISTPQPPVKELGSSEQAVIITRALMASDVHFILSSWVKGSRKANEGWAIPHEIYYKYKEIYVRRWLQNPLRKVILAVAKDDPDHILGYIVYSNELGGFVDFCYVKHVFRGYGIANMLFKATGLKKKGLQITHLTDPVKSYMANHRPSLHAGSKEFKECFIYNPFILGV